MNIKFLRIKSKKSTKMAYYMCTGVVDVLKLKREFPDWGSLKKICARSEGGLNLGTTSTTY